MSARTERTSPGPAVYDVCAKHATRIIQFDGDQANSLPGFRHGFPDCRRGTQCWERRRQVRRLQLTPVFHITIGLMMALGSSTTARNHGSEIFETSP